MKRQLTRVVILAAVLAAFVSLAPQAQAEGTCSSSGATTVCLDKTASPNPAIVGQPLTFTLTETAKAGEYQGGVLDPLPSGLTFVSGSWSSGSQSGACILPSGNTVICSIRVSASPNNPFGFGDVETIKIVVTPTQAGSITNTAHDDFPGQSGNNTATATVQVSSSSCKKPHKHHHKHKGHHHKHKAKCRI